MQTHVHCGLLAYLETVIMWYDGMVLCGMQTNHLACWANLQHHCWSQHQVVHDVLVIWGI